MIGVRGITKSFGATPVLRGVDLTIHGLTAVLGASGSGKTTLLRIIAGLEAPDAGSVSIEGRVGYVPQDAVLFPHLTVTGNIAFGLHRRDRRSGRVSDLVDLVGLRGLEDRYPHQLSGGQQHRVALGRALAISPQLVLLDEPFASLDVALRASVRADVCRILAACGASTVLVTHDQDEALSIADHVAVLRDGLIVQAGTPHELYTTPVDAELATFLGDANLLSGTVRERVATTALGTLPIDGDCPDGPATVLIRPEQIEVGSRGVAGVVTACEYFGHDAMLDVSSLGGLRVRVNGAAALPSGTAVTVAAAGPVTAWPLTSNGCSIPSTTSTPRSAPPSPTTVATC
ncbi:MAG: ABC transporter ATP-binding protein [Acidimicrobiales bacterium]